MRKSAFWTLLGGFCLCCSHRELPVIPHVIATEQTPHDTDDPAIWVHPEDPSKSIVFGTDKDTEGGVYAFDLKGKIIPEMTVRNLKRPNNVDIETGVLLNDSTKVDLLAVTEREMQRIRLYKVPEMLPLDFGGIPVFEDETDPQKRLPMGIGLYKSPGTDLVYAVVSRKYGPRENYLYQYLLTPAEGGFKARLVRKFGAFSGSSEIEAIAVDDELGFIYYADEGECIRKYHAEPGAGDREISCFGGEYFREDIEGIAIIPQKDNPGYILVSDQQRNQFNLFSRKGNTFLKAVNLGTRETDGCDAVSVSLNEQFPNGLFVAMNNDRNFFFYNISDILEDPE